jgi:hypothetical protein
MSRWEFSEQIIESTMDPRNLYTVYFAEAVEDVTFNQVLERENPPLAIHRSKQAYARAHPVVKSGIRYVKVSHSLLETVVRDLKRIESISPHFAPHFAVRVARVPANVSSLF